ncbi:MAG: hypothetical protein GDA56_21680 [Hormoscilla sp. GM7CHS1pb]|nr:hypothetical protein [Hormoscilla sp. GM7CHS1pb]
MPRDLESLIDIERAAHEYDQVDVIQNQLPQLLVHLQPLLKPFTHAGSNACALPISLARAAKTSNPCLA